MSNMFLEDLKEILATAMPHQVEDKVRELCEENEGRLGIDECIKRGYFDDSDVSEVAFDAAYHEGVKFCLDSQLVTDEQLNEYMEERSWIYIDGIRWDLDECLKREFIDRSDLEDWLCRLRAQEIVDILDEGTLQETVELAVEKLTGL